MSRFLTAAAALTAALATTTAAQAATVIDFDEFKHGGVVRVYSDPVISKGFSFTADQANNGLGVWGSVNNADPDGATLVNWSTRVVTVRRTDGEMFSLDSLEAADTYNAGGASEFLFTFFDGVRESTELVTLDRLRGLETLDFNRQRLEWFSYTQVGGGGIQIDNVVLGAPVVSAVPEPATWAMMILGFGGVGAVLRNRRRETPVLA